MGEIYCVGWWCVRTDTFRYPVADNFIESLQENPQKRVFPGIPRCIALCDKCYSTLRNYYRGQNTIFKDYWRDITRREYETTRTVCEVMDS